MLRRRHTIWVTIALIVTIAAWLAWTMLTVESDLAG